MASSKPELLYSLPTELHLAIIPHLDYGAAINLSRVNRHFHTLIDPEEWPAASKRAFLKRAQLFPQHNVNRRVVRHRHAGYETLYSLRSGFACFTCWRVRPMHCFGSHNILRYPKMYAAAYPPCSSVEGCKGELDDDRQEQVKEARMTTSEARRCLDCCIAANELRHGLEVVVPRQTSTLIDRSRPERPLVLLVDMVEAEDMVFCDECGVLHEQEVWLRTCGRRTLEPGAVAGGGNGTVKDGLDPLDHGSCYWQKGRA